VHPLQGGLFRLKYRTDRRPGFPVVNPLIFYPGYAWETLKKAGRFYLLNRTYKRLLKRVQASAHLDRYADLALKPAGDEDLDDLRIFGTSEGAKKAADRARKNAKPRVVAAAE